MTQRDPELPRATSIAAYRAVMCDGTIGRQHALLYAMLYASGPMTATECISKANAKLLREDRQAISEQTHTRFAELRRRGLIREVGKKVCTHTTKRCIAWDVTSSPPLPPEKTEPTEQKPTPSVPTSAGPTPAQFAAASVELRSLRTLAAMHGRGFSEALLRVCEWIHGKGNS